MKSNTTNMQNSVPSRIKSVSSSSSSKRSSGTITGGGSKASTGGSSARKNSCKCTSGFCLKLYCECFARGALCGPNCKCRDCSNTKAEEDGKVKEARKSYLATKANKRTKTQSTSCSCKSHRCLKKYCDCFSSRKPCTQSCKCVDCNNR